MRGAFLYLILFSELDVSILACLGVRIVLYRRLVFQLNLNIGQPNFVEKTVEIGIRRHFGWSVRIAAGTRLVWPCARSNFR